MRLMEQQDIGNQKRHQIQLEMEKTAMQRLFT
jgi:hypothetical protein